VLRCGVAAVLKLRCQRCMGALDHEVDADILLALASGADEERQLPERFDPLLVSDKPIRLRDLVEDELLLALPQIPMHERDVCRTNISSAEASQEGFRASPFSVLGELRRGR